MFAKRCSVWAVGVVLGLSVTTAQGVGTGQVHDFPSPGSSFTGVTDIGGGQFGWFWSASLNQTVSEVLVDTEPEITRALLRIEIPQNALVNDSVEWAVTINNLTAGDFAVDPGFTGAMFLDLRFAPIEADGGSYEVMMQVVNEVPLLGGSHSLGFDEPHAHSIQLIPEPASAAILSICALAVVRRGGNTRRKSGDRDR